MASYFSACEDSRVSFEAGFNGQTNRINGSDAIPNEVGDIPKFRRGYSHYHKSRAFHGRNKDYPMSNPGGSNRHNRNENGPSASDGTSSEYYNLTRDFSRTNISQSNGGTNNQSKKYYRNRGQPLRETICDRQSTNLDAGTQFNHTTSDNFQSHLNLDAQQPGAYRKWNHKSGSNYNHQSNGNYYKRRDPRHDSKEVFENWRENLSHSEHCDGRNASNSNIDENARDGLRNDTNDNYRNNRRGRRGKWPNNDARQKYQSQEVKVERSQADRFCNNFDSTERGRGRTQKDNKISEKTFENQRELLEEQLRSNACECLVCCTVLRRSSAMWSCSKCFNIFHLTCIKKWATSSAIKDPNHQEEEEEATGGEAMCWRCPTCQNTSSKFPNEYRCFCGKQRDPPNSFDAPHSCGEVCGKKRGVHCKHPCNILCHPGPCPSCLAMVSTTCGCGKQNTYTMCNASVDLKCQEACNKSLNCGNHVCLDVCHKGSCLPCPVKVEQTCHCSKKTREVACGSKESFESSYSCLGTCNKPMDCGNHSCTKTCHPDECDECLLKPELINRCACGKSDVETLLKQAKERKKESETTTPTEVTPCTLTNKKTKKKKKKDNVEEARDEECSSEILWPRISCLDPLPRCMQVCGKELPCGTEENKHYCKKKCHNGPCLDCSETSKVLCACRSATIEVTCKELLSKMNQGQQIKCNRRCNKKLSCGKHRCNANCCTDADHVCQKKCKRKQSCGLHECAERCHSGNCDRCWFTSFEELTCRCGASVTYPPIPCGTKRPFCRRPCTREHSCDHLVHHSCHDEAECPPCVQLTERMCLCGKELRKNVPCYLREVRCGNLCGKVLPCGSHFCQRSCHDGPCLNDLNPKCTQPCQLSRPSCNHPCLAPCHAYEPCPKTNCSAEVQVTCECGRKEGKIPCLKESSSDSSKVASRFWLSRTLDCEALTANNRIPCDKECAIYQRNKRLAEALDIKEANFSSEPEFQPNYSDFLKDYTKRNAFFVSKIEHELQQLVKSTKMLQNDNDRKVHSFKIMKKEQRQVIHELAECYGVETESQDEEPYRSVIARATKSKCRLPKTFLASNLSTTNSSAAPTVRSTLPRPAAPTASAKTQLSPSTSAKPLARARRPVIDYFDYED